jgi:hypothetical protein
MMADEQIQCFPTNHRDQVVITSPIVHAILPLLRRVFLHPQTVKDTSAFLNNSVFKESLYIEDITTQFIKVIRKCTLQTLFFYPLK